MSATKTHIYGYMHVHDGLPKIEAMQAELLMFRWAQLEGYDLTVIFYEDQPDSTSILTELVDELRLTGDTDVVVPSAQHFGTSTVVQDHLSAYTVHDAAAELGWEFDG